MAVNILPIATDNIVNQAEQSAVIVQGSNAVAGSSVSITATQGATTLSQSVTASGTGAWSSTSLNFSGFQESTVGGPITVSVNDGTGATTASVTKDTVAPTPQLPFGIAIDDIVNIAESSAVSLSGTGAEPNGFVNIVFVQGSNVKSVIVHADASGNFNNNASPINFNSGTTPFTSGAAQAIVLSSDAAGNTGSGSRNITIDLTPPSPPLINTPIAGDNVANATEAEQMLISGTAAVPNQPVSIEFFDGVSTIVAPGITANASGVYALVSPGVDIRSLAQGPITVKVTTVDTSGNPASSTAVFTMDKTAPSVSISGPANGLLTNAAYATNAVVTGTGAEPNSTVTVRFSVGTLSITATTTATATGAFNLSPGPNISSFPDGPVTITASSSDSAGNVGVDQVVITKDASIPPVLITTPIAGNNIVSLAEGTALFISGTGADAGRNVTITLTQGATTATKTVVAAANGFFSNSSDTFNLSAFNDGTITVTVTTEDAAGNIGTDTKSVTYDKTAPVTTNFRINSAADDSGALLASPLNRNTTNDQTLVISGTAGAAGTVVLTANPSGGGAGIAAGTVSVSAPASPATSVNWSITTPALPAGTYTFSAVLRDDAPNDSGAAVNNLSGPITIDLVAPVVTLVTPITDGNVTNAAESASLGAAISGTTDVPGGEVVVTFAAGASSISRTVTANSTPNGSGTFNWSLASNPANILSLPDGTISLLVTSRDAAGNTGAAGTTFTKQTAAPAVVIATPIELDNRINAAEAPHVLVEGSGAAPNRPVTVTFTGSPTGSVTKTVTADALGGFTLLGNEANLAGFSQGNVTITVSSTDSAGNTGSASAIVLLDTVIGTVAIGTTSTVAVSPAVITSIFNSTTGTAVVLTGSGAEPNSSVLITFNDTVPGSESTAPITRTVTSSGTGTFSLTPANAVNLLGLLDGPITIEVRSSDLAGNTSTATREIVKDTVSPSISISDPVAGNNIINASEVASVVISGIALDGAFSSGFSSVTVSITGPTSTTPATITQTVSVSGGAYVATFNVSSFVDGTLTINVSGVDAAGNSGSASKTVTLDRTAPAIAITTPIAGDNRVNASEMTALNIQGTGAAPSATVVVTFSDGTNTVTRSTTANASGAYSLAPSSLADLTSLNNGTVFVTASSTDASGNIGSATVSIAKDAAAPTVTINTIAGDDAVYGGEASAVTVSGTVSDSPSSSSMVGRTVTVRFTSGATTITASSTTVTGGGTFSAGPTNISTLPDGPVTVTVTVTDVAENVGTATRTIVKDTNGPTVVINPFAGNDVLNSSEQSGGTSGRTVSGTAEAFAGVQVFIAGGTISIGPFSGSADASGAYSIIIPNTGSNSLAALPQGTNTITVIATDTVGNQGSQTRSFNKDTIAPILDVTVTSFSDPISASEANAVTISGTVTTSGSEATINRNSSLVGRTVTVTFSDVNNSPVTGDITATGILTAGATSDDPLNFTTAAANLSSLNNGGITATFTITDVAGNTFSTTRSYTLDKNAPTTPAISNATYVQGGSTITLLSGGSTNFNTYAGTINLNGTGPTETPAASVQLLRVGSSTVIGTGTISGGAWSIPLTNLPDGTYDFVARTVDAAGNTSSNSSPFQLIIDTIAPPITMNVIAGDGVINENEAPAVVISGAGAAPNRPVSIRIQQGAIDQTFSVTATATGTYTMTINLQTGPTSTVAPFALALADGTSNITITASSTDVAGNTGSASRTVSKDTMAPTVTIDLPIEGNDIVSALEMLDVLVSGTASEARPVVVTFTDSSVAGTTVSATVLASGTSPTFTYTLAGNSGLGIPSSEVNLSSLIDGLVTVVSTVIDAAGNVGTATRVITLDRVAPSPTITTPIMGDNFVNNFEQNAVIIRGSGAHPSSLVEITLIDSATPTANSVSYTVTSTSTGSYTTGTAGVAIPSSLIDGPVTVRVRSTDSAGFSTTDPTGNRGEATATITLDRVAPAVTVTAPIAVDNVVNETEVGAVVISGTNAHPNGAVKITILDSKTPTANSVVLNTTASATGVYSATGNLSSLIDGPLSIQVEAKDPAGNFVIPTVPTVIKDTQAPQIAITTPIMTDGVINAAEQNNVIIAGTNAVPGALVTVTIDDSNPATASVVRVVTADGSGNYSLISNQAGVAALDDGVLTVSVTNADPAGNVRSASTTVTKDATPPALVIGSNIAGNDYINSSEASSVSVSVSGAVSGRDVTISLASTGGGSRTSTGAANASGAYSATFNLTGTPAFNDGFVDVTATSTDAAGNSTTVTRRIVLDRASPSVQAFATPTSMSYPTTTANIPNGLSVNTFVVMRNPRSTSSITDNAFVNDNTLVVVGRVGGSTTTADSDTIVGSTVTVRRNGSALGTTTVDANGQYYFETGVLPEGASAFTVIVTDLAGNSSTAATDALDVTIDTVAPTVSITAPIMDDNRINGAEVSSVIVAGTTNNPNSFVTVTFTVGSSSVNEIVTTNASGAFSLTGANLSSLPDGTVIVTAETIDAANNSGFDTKTVTKDTVNPTPLTITNVAGDNIINASEVSGPVVTGTREPNLAVTVTITNGVTTLTAVAAAGSSGTYSVTLPSVAGFADGPLTVQAISTDAAGNVSTTSPLTVIKDTSVPVVTITTPIAGDNLVSNSEKNNVVVSGTAEAGRPVVITFRDSANNTVVVTEAAGPSGAYTIAAPNVANLTPLLDGPITVTVTCTDTASNTGSASATITKDTSGPVITSNLLIAQVSTSTTITQASLNSVDAISSPSAVSYAVTTGPTAGYLALASAPGTAIGSFTQAQINANQIVYVSTGAGTFDSFTFLVTDAAGNVSSGVQNIQVLAAVVPKVDSVVINGGNAQRSRLSSITVTFNTVVNVQPGAFTVLRRDDNPGAPFTVGPVPGLIVGTPSIVSGKTVVNLTFGSGTYTDMSGSLVDGNYQLEVNAALVTSVIGTFNLDGNNDGVPGGDFVFGNQATDRFFRLFGDSDGDGDVDGLNLAAFSSAFGKLSSDSLYRSEFDSDQDGDIDGIDLALFAGNLFKLRNLGGF